MFAHSDCPIELQQLNSKLRAMDVFMSSLRHQYAVEKVVIINDPAQPPVSSHLKKPLKSELPITAYSTNVDSLAFSVYDDMASLIQWGERPPISSRRSKRYIKQCRWTGNSIANSDPLPAAPMQIKKDTSPTRPTRRS